MADVPIDSMMVPFFGLCCCLGLLQFWVRLMDNPFAIIFFIGADRVKTVIPEGRVREF